MLLLAQKQTSTALFLDQVYTNLRIITNFQHIPLNRKPKRDKLSKHLHELRGKHTNKNKNGGGFLLRLAVGPEHAIVKWREPTNQTPFRN